MNIQLILLGTLLLIVGVILMMKYKFYKYKISDALFATKMKVFLGAAIFVIMGVMILFNELRKLFH